MILFNKPYIIGKELTNIQHSVDSGKIIGDGIFKKNVINFLNIDMVF